MELVVEHSGSVLERIREISAKTRLASPLLAVAINHARRQASFASEN
jgi:hypothetical protein